MKPCDKHKKNPVKGYNECAGCEIEMLQSENLRLKNAESEIERLKAIAQQAHDRILRGDSDKELLIILESAWKNRPNSTVSGQKLEIL